MDDRREVEGDRGRGLRWEARRGKKERSERKERREGGKKEEATCNATKRRRWPR